MQIILPGLYIGISSIAYIDNTAVYVFTYCSCCSTAVAICAFMSVISLTRWPIPSRAVAAFRELHSCALADYFAP
nr:hypothetical protein [Salmonella enterica subsp. enterica serovar Rissen]